MGYPNCTAPIESSDAAHTMGNSLTAANPSVALRRLLHCTVGDDIPCATAPCSDLVRGRL